MKNNLKIKTIDLIQIETIMVQLEVTQNNLITSKKSIFEEMMKYQRKMKERFTTKGDRIKNSYSTFSQKDQFYFQLKNLTMFSVKIVTSVFSQKR